MGRHYLITGGAGFIGSHLVDRLLAMGERVTVIDNFDPFYPASIKRSNIARHLTTSRFRLIEADLRDRGETETVFADNSFDVIIHLAAKAGVRPSVTNPHDYQEVNIAGTLNLLEAARRQGVGRFIFASSSSVYGPGASAPFREEAALHPI